jgi:hypothetical protein
VKCGRVLWIRCRTTRAASIVDVYYNAISWLIALRSLRWAGLRLGKACSRCPWLRNEPAPPPVVQTVLLHPDSLGAREVVECYGLHQCIAPLITTLLLLF